MKLISPKLNFLLVLALLFSLTIFLGAGCSSSIQKEGSNTIDSDNQDQILQKYPSGTLVQGSSSEVYLILNGKKSLIPDQETFIARGYNSDKIITISDEELKSIPTGPAIPKSQTINSGLDLGGE